MYSGCPGGFCWAAPGERANLLGCPLSRVIQKYCVLGSRWGAKGSPQEELSILAGNRTCWCLFVFIHLLAYLLSSYHASDSLMDSGLGSSILREEMDENQ
jgi:hypothetical protein